MDKDHWGLEVTRMQQHPLSKLWRQEIEARALLLGVPTTAIGWASHTFAKGPKRMDISTLEEMDDDEWDRHFNEAYGVKKFFEWVEEHGEKEQE